MLAPFIIELDEEMENEEEEEKFIKEKSELFVLIMCIILQNRDVFKYLWRNCSYIWNDVHLVILADFIFDSQWEDGCKVLFASANTHQIFNAMNLYEKEKFLKYCDKSIRKTPKLIVDFRY